jgi:hypothetical protein
MGGQDILPAKKAVRGYKAWMFPDIYYDIHSS